MSAGNTDNLRRAATAKHEAAVRRAEAGLRRLLRAHAPITFEAVAAEAGVSKDFLYRSSLRHRIERLRADTAARPRVVPDDRREEAAGTSSVVRTLTREIAELRRRHHEEVAELRAALAAAHGELLTLRRRHGIH